jgi:hypothetical protein
MLEVTIYSSLDDDEPVVHENVDFVSLVSNATYGPPPLIAPNSKPNAARAGIDQTVLYINTHFVPMWEIKRVSD